jgi:hypothetical protein
MTRIIAPAFILLAVTTSHAARADANLAAVEPPAATDDVGDGSAAATMLPPTTTSTARGAYASFGAGFLPAGVDGPGAANLEMFEGGGAFRLGNVDLRIGAILALESTYYQSSVSGLVIARAERYVGPRFSFGGGFGVGVGSFTPQNGDNADNGTSPELTALVVPARLHLGDERRLELSLQVGTIYLASFSESDFFYELAIGYVRW